jgi:hypothetical protein
MLAVLWALTRRAFHVPFEAGRLLHAVVVIAGMTVAGELLLPTDGVEGFLTRALVLAAIPLVLWFSGFPTAAERRFARDRVRR